MDCSNMFIDSGCEAVKAVLPLNVIHITCTLACIHTYIHTHTHTHTHTHIHTYVHTYMHTSIRQLNTKRVMSTKLPTAQTQNFSAQLLRKRYHGNVTPVKYYLG